MNTSNKVVSKHTHVALFLPSSASASRLGGEFALLAWVPADVSDFSSDLLLFCFVTSPGAVAALGLAPSALYT